MFTKYLPGCKCHTKMTFTINLRTFTMIIKGGLYNLTKDCKGVVKNKLYKICKDPKTWWKAGLYNAFTSRLHNL